MLNQFSSVNTSLSQKFQFFKSIFCGLKFNQGMIKVLFPIPFINLFVSSCGIKSNQLFFINSKTSSCLSFSADSLCKSSFIS
ncbi:MAG: hypothetical protein U9R37_00755, partial [Campylobacterota bacterium]|nr:hypothetical protein [Campylobacterota bacterium]